MRVLPAFLAFITCAPGLALAADPPTCQAVRMAEPGWNDLALTTGAASVVLQAMGYKPSSNLLGIDVIYASLKTQRLDVFLGYWDPAMRPYAEPYEKDGSVENVRVNLTGAKYTFVVPRYVADAGVHHIKDLVKFSDQFSQKLYGIEPGSNELMLKIAADPKFDLADWEVVESSETAMLAQVKRAIDKQQFIVFQGWAPHPMNAAFDLVYLAGGDDYYGPDFGAATVTTQVRAGYLEECPNVGKFLQNLQFDISFENEGMAFLIDEGMMPEDAGKAILEKHPEVLDGWLEGVTTFDGQPALPAVKKALNL